MYNHESQLVLVHADDVSSTIFRKFLAAWKSINEDKKISCLFELKIKLIHTRPSSVYSRVLYEPPLKSDGAVTDYTSYKEYPAELRSKS